MNELRIDGQICDLCFGKSLPEAIVQLDLGRCADLSALRKGHSVEIVIPSSKHNDRIVGFAADPKCKERFNSSYHEVTIGVDGSTLMSGVVHLLGVESDADSRVSYRLRVTSGGDNWVESVARRELAESAVEYSQTFDGEAIERSWSEEDALVRFLPIHFDSYQVEAEEPTLLSMQRMMTVDDYHPFISVARLTQAIFDQAGYRLQSDFMQSEEFRRLYISGKYNVRNQLSQSRLASYTGFEAGRSQSVEATAGYDGRVWFSQQVLVHSVGNFVDTTEGEGLYNSNGVLRISDEGLSYHPKSTQMVGFEYEFRYMTDYKIISPTRLQGFDSIYLGAGADMKFELRNPFEDRRGAVRGGAEYLCQVFDFQEGAVMRLISTSGSSQRLLAEISEATTKFTTSLDYDYGECELQVKESSGAYVPYEGEWALYDGYVDLDGQIEVAVKLRTPAEQITPATGKSFNQIYIYGAAEGQSLKLLESCRLRAVFSSTPALGSVLSFEDIVPSDVTQLEFLDSLQQMFNLRFLTSERERTISVEPLDDLKGSDVVDWRAREVFSDGITISDQALGVSRERVLGYRTEVDGAVGRFNQESGETFGQWRYTMQNRVASYARKQIRNPLFSPTLSMPTQSTAPSALIMQAGDRDSESQSLSMRIVSYRGMRSLPEGESWGYPSFGQEYPYAAFHQEGVFTLCFEDRDGVQGLHRHYDEEFLQQDRCSAIELSIRLQPYELEQLCDAAEASKTFGSLYLLNISGEDALYRLQAVTAYHTERAVARCRFHRTLTP